MYHFHLHLRLCLCICICLCLCLCLHLHLRLCFHLCLCLCLHLITVSIKGYYCINGDRQFVNLMDMVMETEPVCVNRPLRSVYN